MPDWTAYVREHLPAGRLKGGRDDAIVADLAQQLDDTYQDALAGGASEQEASDQARHLIPDWEALVRDILRASPGSRKASIDRWCEDADTSAGAARVRGSRWSRLCSDLKQDLLLGIRILLKNPGFTAIALLTLACGIGINTAAFSVVHGMVAAPQRYPDSESLVFLWGTRPPDRLFGYVSAADARDWKAESRSFSDISLFQSRTQTWTGVTEAEPLRTLEADASLLTLIGVQTRLGRLYGADDAASSTAPVVVVTDTLWRTRLGADPGVVGRTLVIDGVHHNVIGVLEPTPKLVELTHVDVDVLTPVPLAAAQTSSGQRMYRVLARLRPGIPLETAQSEMDGISAAMARAHPDATADTGVRLELLEDRLVSPSDRLFGLLLIVAVAAILMMACVNLASMLLAKAVTRTREVAIRLALGAGRQRIVRQLLTESLVLALTGGALGFVLAYVGVRVLVASVGDSQLSLEMVSPDVVVLMYTLAISLASAAVFGLAPASMVSSIAVTETIKAGGAGGGRGFLHRRFRRGLVVAEMAVGLLLLICCGLAVRNMQALRTTELGFNAENLVTMQVELPEFRYNADQWSVTYGELIERLEALPGIRAVGASFSFPIGGGFQRGAPARVEGSLRESGPAPERLSIQPVTPGYFPAMEIPLLRGRTFADRDTATSLPVATLAAYCPVIRNRHFCGMDDRVAAARLLSFIETRRASRGPGDRSLDRGIELSRRRRSSAPATRLESPDPSNQKRWSHRAPAAAGFQRRLHPTYLRSRRR